MTVSGALKPETHSSFQVLNAVVRMKSFFSDTYFNEAENLHEPETDSAVNEKMSLAPAGPSYSTRRTQNQASCDHNIVSKENAKNTLRFLGSSIAFVAQCNHIHSDLVFVNCKIVLHRQLEMVETVVADPERQKIEFHTALKGRKLSSYLHEEPRSAQS